MEENNKGVISLGIGIVTVAMPAMSCSLAKLSGVHGPCFDSVVSVCLCVSHQDMSFVLFFSYHESLCLWCSFILKYILHLK